MRGMIRLTHDPIDHADLTEAVRSPHCGAVALFLGTVRDLTGEFVTVCLDYEAYGPMAEKSSRRSRRRCGGGGRLVTSRWCTGSVGWGWAK